MITTQNILWVIRAAGERTQKQCIKLILDFVPQNHVIIIQEKPFAKALQKSFQACVESSFEWSIHIDADVLISKEGCEKLIDKINHVSGDVFAVQGVTLDKFIPIYRTAGNGIYRNSALRLAANFIPRDDGIMRPEGHLVDQMIAKGYNKLRTNIKVGVHDYEQAYSDIYRKISVHAQKHRNIITEAKKYWEEHLDSDQDFKIALLAARVSQYSADELALHTNFKQEEREVIFHLYDIANKELLDERLGHDTVTTWLEKGVADKVMQEKKYPEFYKGDYFLRDTNFKSQLGSKLTHLGKRLKRKGKYFLNK